MPAFLSTIERRSLKTPGEHHYFIPASYQAYRLLHVGFVLAPLAAGIDKFFYYLAKWDLYLSPLAVQIFGAPATTIMRAVGIIEIGAAILVAFRPRVGGLVVAAWMAAIVANLLSIPAYFDIALRDIGLCLGALALSRLSVEFEHYRRPKL